MVGDITSKECVLLRVKLFNRTGLVFLVILFLCFTPQAHASFGFKLDGTLDKAAISHAYFEGEFARILPPLETYRQSFPKSATRDDSVFVYKYLSVIYAADPNTKTKAESYMVQLIKLMPTIELIDLYISDNIEAIFKNVKESYEHQQEYVKDHDELGHVKSDKKTISEKHNGNGHAIWWLAGGVGVAAAVGTVAYFALEPKPEAKKTVVPVFQGGQP